MRIKFQFGLKWFLLGTSLIAVLIGTVGQRAYHQWQENAAVAHRARAIRELEKYGVRAYKKYDRVENQYGEIDRLQFPRRLCESKHFQWAADVGGLEWLDLDATGFRDADAPTLLASPDLKALHLVANSGVTDETLRTVGQLPLLVRLHLNSTSITDRGLADVARLTKLRQLTLEKTAITSQGLDTLRTLQSLQCLSLRDTKVDDSGLDAIGELRGLEMIMLDHTRVRGPGLATLAKLPKLDFLSLSGCPLQDGSGLATLKKVSHLSIMDSQISPGILSHACEMENLRFLSLHGSGVNDAHLLELASAKQLTLLVLGKTNASEAALRELRVQLPSTEVRGEPRDR